MTLWATVHGFSFLLLDGPLRVLTDEQREQAIDRMIDILNTGLGVADSAAAGT